jgi:hypothetical protein
MVQEDIVDESSSEEESEESEEAFDENLTLDTDETPIVSEEELRMRKQLSGAVVAGARGMWGFISRPMEQVM